LQATSGACRRLGIRSCVRPHDDAHKGTFVCNLRLFQKIILLLLPGGAGGVKSIFSVNNFMEEEGRCTYKGTRF
jgi:hypothetical protein